MLNFPYVPMPKTLCELLRINMKSVGIGFRHLEATVRNDKSLDLFMSSLFKDKKGERLSFDEIIGKFGWHGLRNHLTSVFLYYAQYGVFPKTFYLEKIQDILDFELELSEHSVEGFSSSYLYGLYTKMAFYKTGAEIKATKEHIEIFKKNNKKTKRIDWMMITLQHFYHYFGKEKLHKMIEHNFSYQRIFSLLNYGQKKNYLNNILAYGASIYDNDFFCREFK